MRLVIRRKMQYSKNINQTVQPLLTRPLQIDEVEKIGEIQRAEEIHGYYRLQNGVLTVVPHVERVQSFDPKELASILDRQRKILAGGGVVIGAFDGEKIVGVVSVENRRRGANQNYCKMDILYVSAGYRGRGIGKRLVDLSKTVTLRVGATKLYISATPTTTTVDFYLRLGAVLATELDPELYQQEPEDIHLELKAGDFTTQSDS